MTATTMYRSLLHFCCAMNYTPTEIIVSTVPFRTTTIRGICLMLNLPIDPITDQQAKDLAKETPFSFEAIKAGFNQPNN